MTFLVLTDQDSGAPTLNAVNGALCAVLDWALVQAGWAIEYSSGNARVYRPGSGKRRRLHVRHDSAVSGSVGRALVRGCEGASSATSLTDPFPTVAQVADANSNWHVSTSTDATARAYRIYLSETFVAIFVEVSTTDQWSMGMFGDAPPLFAGDDWNTICLVRNTSTVTIASTATSGIGTPTNTGVAAGQQLFWCRDITGAIKSSQGNLNTSGSTMGGVAGTPAPRNGYQNRIYREKVYANCAGSSTTTVGTATALPKRGGIPNLWSPMHIGPGSFGGADTFTDTEYDPTALFRFLKSNGNPVCIMEETDTWSPG